MECRTITELLEPQTIAIDTLVAPSSSAASPPSFRVASHALAEPALPASPFVRIEAQAATTPGSSGPSRANIRSLRHSGPDVSKVEATYTCNGQSNTLGVSLRI
jgi:hypothetical protein